MAKIIPWWTLDKTQPSTFDDLWKEVPTEIYLTWKTSHKNLVTKAFVGYIMRVYTFVELCRVLKAGEVPGSLALWREMRLSMVQNFNTVLGLKLMLLRCQNRKRRGYKPKLDREIRQNNLYPNDKAIFLSLANMEIEQQININIKKLPIKIPDAKIAQKQCGQCLVETESFFGKFVSKKLRFIYQSNNYQHHDILNQLNLKATETFYLSTPWLTEEHRKSTVKRAGHNHGIKLIKEYTAPERARSRRTTDGQFENVIIMLNEPDLEKSNVESDAKIEQINYMFNETDEQYVYEPSFFDDQRISNTVALKKYLKENKASHSIITLLSLSDNENFVKFAESNCGYVFSNTENVYEELGSEKYYNLVAKFLNRPIDQVMTTILDLQNVLSPVA